MNEINKCEVCGGNNLESVLDLGLHPMCDDLVPIDSSRLCKEYPIEILFCKTCLTGHQHYQVPKEDLFPSSYHYRSRFTADVLQGMQNLVNSCEERFEGMEGKKVLDIGCNDGSLLDFFKKSGAQTFGIEPTDAYQDAEEKGHILFNDYLSKDIAEKFVTKYDRPDFITFTNVFAHIENLGEVIDSLKLLMKEETIIVIENHYLGAVLQRSQFDTFYHEHPRTYSYTSFVRMAESLDTKLLDVDFPSRYGGNIRVFFGKSNTLTLGNRKLVDEVIKKEKEFVNDFEILKNNIDVWLINKKAAIDKLVKEHGKIRAKAFPGRAAILVKMLELDENQISCVYEKPGSLKIGHFLPGTRIPIRSDEDLLSLPDQNLPIINLAWHISKEINQYLTSQGYSGEIIDILSEKDFQPSQV